MGALLSRRRFLSRSVALAGAGAVAVAAPAGALAPRRRVLTPDQRRTLDAAVARLIPADGPDDWSAADVGAGDYIERLLSGPRRLYAGGPYRRHFSSFQALSRPKRIGWRREIRRLRQRYTDGLAELDRRCGGDFAAAPAPVQDAVLTSLDMEGSPFFASLYDHTMEGVYGHPVYGGNRGYRAWDDLSYQGDVHGVRFPQVGSKGAWNVYGGYAPEEMIQPGTGGGLR